MLRLVFLFLTLTTLPGAGAAVAETDPHRSSVPVVADRYFDVTLPEGTGQIPVYVSRDWTQPLPDVTRAILVFHGLRRNADVYYADAQKTLAEAGPAGDGTLLVVPQFLSDEDIVGHHLPPATLRWGWDSWSGGEAAHGPIPASPFDAIDAILARLADPRLFPNLRHVVVAGHSAGAQLVQRYAIAVKGEAPLLRRDIHLRYVVANPSSYLYFGDDRPLPDGSLAPFAGAAACPQFNRWKYGLAAGLPAYVASPAAALEASYAARDVIYLLGTADTNPDHPLLDKSCAGEAQGPFRLARGHAYFSDLQARDGAVLRHRLWEVPGVGHDGGRMLGSACGLAALFDTPGCAK